VAGGDARRPVEFAGASCARIVILSVAATGSRPRSAATVRGAHHPRCLASVPAPRPVTGRIDGPPRTLSGSATRSHRRASPGASAARRRAKSLLAGGSRTGV